MASPRPPPTEMQSLFVEFGLPIEPRSFDEASDCKDPGLEILGPIDSDLEELPYANDEYQNDPDWKLDDDKFATIVYIEDFFIDGRDFAYYIIGQPHVTAFKKGIYSMPAYNGPIVATPMMSYNSEILNEESVYDIFGGQVERSHGAMEEVKWKYLFETARVAWSKLLIDPRKLELIRKRNARLLRYRKEKAIREENIDWEVQSATSTECREIETASLSAKKRGKMKSTSVEETRDSAYDKGWEAERDLMRALFDTITMQCPSPGQIAHCLKTLTTNLLGEKGADEPIGAYKFERNRWINEFGKDLMRAIRLEHGLLATNGVYTTLFREMETYLTISREKLIAEIVTFARRHRGLDSGVVTRPVERSDVHTVEKPPELANLQEKEMTALDQFTSITGRNRGDSLRVLAQCNWDVQDAVSAHYDGHSPAAESTDTVNYEPGDLSYANFSSFEGEDNKDRQITTDAIGSGSRSHSRPSSTVVAESSTIAGPSGSRSFTKLSKEEEEAELAAYRARVAQLIAQNDEDEHPYDSSAASNTKVRSQLATIAEWAARLEAQKSNPSAFEAVGTAAQRHAADSIARLDRARSEESRLQSVGPATKGTMQTVLNVIGANSSRKRRDSGGGTRNESPTKKQRGGTGPSILQVSDKENHVRSIRDETPTPVKPQPQPEGEGFHMSGSSTRSPPNYEPDFDTKVAILRATGLADDKRALEVMFENVGNVDRALKVLESEATKATPQTLRFILPNPTSTGSVNMTRLTPRRPAPSPPAESSKARETRLASLRDMGFPDEARNVKVLEECHGDLDLAIELLLAGSENTSSGDSEAEAHDMSVLMDFETTGSALISTNKDKGRESVHAGCSKSKPVANYHPIFNPSPTSSQHPPINWNPPYSPSSSTSKDKDKAPLSPRSKTRQYLEQHAARLRATTAPKHPEPSSFSKFHSSIASSKPKNTDKQQATSEHEPLAAIWTHWLEELKERSENAVKGRKDSGWEARKGSGEERRKSSRLDVVREGDEDVDMQDTVSGVDVQRESRAGEVVDGVLGAEDEDVDSVLGADGNEDAPGEDDDDILGDEKLFLATIEDAAGEDEQML